MTHTSIPPASLSRRRFLKAAGAAAAAPLVIGSSAFGAAAPSNRLTIGCIGIRNMGGGHLGNLINRNDVQVLAVCDVDEAIRKPGKAKVEKAYAARSPDGSYKGCADYVDFRELLDRKDIDAVVVAVPDHWHVLISMAAAKAGKDIYCEKPLTLAIAEGRALSDTIQRHGRVFQTGSQQRSDGRFRFACELVRNGRIGKLQTIHVGLPGQNAAALPPQPAEPVPDGFDYNMWLGPAPWAPYCKARCHYFFRFCLDYSGGQVTNFGAHDLDISQWALGMDQSGPVEVEPGKCVFPRDGFYNTATFVDFTCTYASGAKLTCSTSGSGVRFEGTEGWVYVNRGKIDANPKSILTTVIGASEVHLYDSRNHWGNFLECIRTRRQTICPAETGHRSATVCHLGNIAMQLGRKLRWNPAAERFVNDPEADTMISRPMRSPWYL